MGYGIVYLLTNPVMPGLVKIGMTAQEDIDKRMRELYTTGVPVPFECKYACKVKTSDCFKIEKALHKAFDPQRVNQNREFFRINVEQAQAILELFHHEDVTEDLLDEAHVNYKPCEEDGKTCYYFTCDWDITIQGIFEKPAPPQRFAAHLMGITICITQ